MKRLVFISAIILIPDRGHADPKLHFNAGHFETLATTPPPGGCWVPPVTTANPPATNAPTDKAAPSAPPAEAPGLPPPVSTGSQSKVAAPPQLSAYRLVFTAPCIRSAGQIVSDIDINPVTGQFTQAGNNLVVTAVYDQTGADVLETRNWTAPGPFLIALKDGGIDIADSLIHPEAKDPCRVKKVPPGDDEVVVDLTSPSIVHAPPRNTLHINQGLYVRVCHDPGQTVTVTWGGTRGLTTSAITGLNGEAENVKALAVTGSPPSAVSTLSFPPRKAGDADLAIFKGTDTTGTPAMSVQLEVEQLYWGSVRFGLGTLLGSWHTFETTTFAGSQQTSIRESSHGGAFEFVGGFAPYLIDVLAWGGRSETGGHNFHLSPYVGFGLVGQSATQGIESFSSFHVGLEFEFAQNFSIATTFVYRRGKGLASGYENGSPIAAGATVDSFTTEKWSPGFAVVVNATPSFLQFSTGSGGSSSGSSGGTR